MFKLIFSNVSLILVYMLLGFIMCKSKKVKVADAKGMSGLLLYVLSPAMIINSFLQIDFTIDNGKHILVYFLTTLIIQLLFIGILYIIFNKKYTDAKYRILTVGGVLGNVGFLGMPVISSIFPDQPIVSCYSSINVMSMNLIVFTIGVFLITNDYKYISFRSAILNPTTLSILVALPIFILNIRFPETIQNSIQILAKMVTPMCMFILGMRLSAANLKAVFTRPFVYITCLLKLVIFPIIAFCCVYWIPFLDNTIKATVVVLASMPAGAVIESLAELHECEQELSANVVLLTTMLSVITIPIVTSILIVPFC